MKSIKDFLPKLCVESFVGFVSFRHKNKSDNSRTFLLSDESVIAFRFPRLMYPKDIEVFIHPHENDAVICSKKAKWVGYSLGFDEYEVRFNNKKIGVGLYFLSTVVDIYGVNLYAYITNDGKIYFSYDEKNSNRIQLTVSDFQYDEPSSFYGGIIYHVFVDRFNRGGNPPCKPGCLIVDDWSVGVPEFPLYPGAPMKNNTFYGGTLDGIINKLDYISSLGANIIYLSPIFDAASNHKYDTGDYMKVDSMFGGDEALLRLISECKKRNIYIIIDGVFNHTGSDSIYFNKNGRYDSLGAYQSQSSPYFSWYSFKEYPDKYTAWWNIEILPRLNLDALDCQDFFVGNGGVIEKYLSLGVDGVRLDVADELSDSFISRIKAKMCESVRSNILYGEVWEDASNKIAYDVRKKYYQGTELDGVMNYPLRTGIIDYVTKKDKSSLEYAIFGVMNNAPKRISDAQMNFLGTHDTERIITVLGGEPSSGKTNSQLRVLRMSNEKKQEAAKLLSSLYTVIATLPGIPSVFYGDEAGLEGYSDPFNRMPFPWGREDAALTEHYRKIGNIRRSNSVYSRGKFEVLLLTNEYFSFSRSEAGVNLVTFFNNSEYQISLTFNSSVKELISGICDKEFILKKHESAIFRTKNNFFTLKRI